MPRLYFTGSRDRPLMISVDNAVGPGCPNHRADVMLVQFMLRVADASPANSSWWQIKEPRVLAIDGAFGEVTQSFIRFMQAQVGTTVQGGGKVAEDGRIHPIINTSMHGPKTGVLMMIVLLNLIYMAGTGSNDITSMQFHPLWPKQLNAGLQVRM